MLMKPVTDKIEFDRVVNAIRKPSSNLMAMIEEFIKSGEALVEIDSSAYKTVYSCANAIKSSLKRCGCSYIKCICVDKKVYLVNNIKTKDMQTQKED